MKRVICEPTQTVKLRQWLWPEMRPYNGFDHIRRVRGWQLTKMLVDIGAISEHRQCCISGAAEGIQSHLEDYYTPWRPYPIAQPIHMALHRRFYRPQEWLEIVDRHAKTGEEWFARLSLEPIDLASQLREMHGAGIADIFARAPIPAHVQIPWQEVHGWAEDQRL